MYIGEGGGVNPSLVNQVINPVLFPFFDNLFFNKRWGFIYHVHRGVNPSLINQVIIAELFPRVVFPKICHSLFSI